MHMDMASGSRHVLTIASHAFCSLVLQAMFDAMTALSTNFNENPPSASRAFDQSRDGFVIGAGGGVVVVEELEHAKARGAKICKCTRAVGLKLGRRLHRSVCAGGSTPPLGRGRICTAHGP